MLAQTARYDAATAFPYALRWIRIAAQFALLWGVATFAHLVVAATRVPLPGNVVGLITMFVLLQTRVVRLEWCEDAATLLVKHMSLFFVPLAVGALAFGSLFGRTGAGALAVLAVSAAVGIVVAGRTVALVRERS